MDVSSIGLNTLFNTYGMKTMRPPGDLDEATQRLIENKDKDGNGTLSAVEISISADAFQLADANADGELDADELKNSVDIIGKELAAQGPPPALPEEDEDDDSDSTEASTLQDIFEQVDVDGDGVLSAEEFEIAAAQIAEKMMEQEPQGPPPPPRDREQATERLVQKLDEDGDGALSAGEIPISSEVFDSADTNQDGVLSLEELRAASKEIGEDLGTGESASRQKPMLAFFRQGSDDTTETLNQIA
ncbi:MAG: EF-hand domain-containing protein [Phycisphaerales bacterium]